MNPFVASSPDVDEPLLSLRGFGVAYGDRRILTSVELDIPTRRIVVMMGPAGTGKSTLLRTLCCEAAPGASVRTFGKASFRAKPLAADNRPVLVAQRLPLFLSTVQDYLADGLPDQPQRTYPDGAAAKIRGRLAARSPVPSDRGARSASRGPDRGRPQMPEPDPCPW
jgi:atypical dual specificity phosphatase